MSSKRNHYVYPKFNFSIREHEIVISIREHYLFIKDTKYADLSFSERNKLVPTIMIGRICISTMNHTLT